MPNMDDFELHRKAKELDNAVKVCLMTASETYYETIREKEHPSLSKALFIYKPIEKEDRVKKINKILDSK